MSSINEKPSEAQDGKKQDKYFEELKLRTERIKQEMKKKEQLLI